jgi:hypothetical protein
MIFIPRLIYDTLFFAHILFRFKEEWPSPPPPSRWKTREENMLRIGSDAKNDGLDKNLLDSKHVVNWYSG